MGELKQTHQCILQADNMGMKAGDEEDLDHLELSDSNIWIYKTN